MAVSILRLTIVCIVVLVSFGPANAQEEQQRRRDRVFDPGVFGPIGELRDPVMRKLLSLTDEQDEQVNVVLKDWSTRFEKYESTPKEERDRKLLEKSLETLEGRIKAILSMAQQDKLSELSRTKTLLTDYDLWHIRHPRYQEELNLDDAQKQHVDALYEEWLVEATQWLDEPKQYDVPLKEYFQKLRTDARETWNSKILKKFASRLNAEQKKRFEEIELQLVCITGGPRVFIDSDIQTKLQLTPEQKQSIQKLAEVVAEKPAKEQREAAYKGYHDCLKVLSESQRKVWIQMLGKLLYPAAGPTTEAR